MTDKLDIRLLTPADFPQMYRTFVDAFSQYSVKMELSKEAFLERMEGKINISYAHSVGVFHGEKLVGFIFNSINHYEGQKTAYNGGTGIIHDYWGRGLTAKMYEFVFPILKNDGIKRCVLEVITTNDRAIKAYHKTGFTQSKHYKCFMLKNGLSHKKAYLSIKLKTSNPENLSAYQPFATANPSMLDSYEQLPFNLKNETCFEALHHNEVIGYLIFQHKTGRISQMAVKPEYRKKGIGTNLLREAYNLSQNKSLTVLNIEKQETEMIYFFETNGFVNELDQFEMELRLGD
ncbi:GNAT family N-acetyltransferase [Reichenbachiella sp. MALMAid0571]|uniref:GNAT family N-acetyltransferase n=1 Tax=Reichenbachiella sp. MALMAid0571 TaxID=3143939 RepID=UPI0032DF69E2